MWSRRISSSEALDIVRRRKTVFMTVYFDRCSPTFLPDREQIWPNAGFIEQLSLFEMCRYAPSMDEGIYVRWRHNIDRQLQGRR